MLGSEAGREHEEYWLKQLSGRLPVLELPTDRPRPAMPDASGCLPQLSSERGCDLRAAGSCPAAAGHALHTAARGVPVGPSSLHRQHGCRDRLSHGGAKPCRLRRASSATSPTWSPCVATCRAIPSFTELLIAPARTVLGALAHQDFPFALLVDRLEQNRDPSRSPVFQDGLRSREAAHAGGAGGVRPGRERRDRLSLGGLQLESLAVEQRVAQFDLTLMMVEAARRSRVRPSNTTPICSTPRRSPASRSTSRPWWRASSRTPPAAVRAAAPVARGASAALGWKGEVKRTSRRQSRCRDCSRNRSSGCPMRCRSCWDDQQLSYRELNRRANQLAHYLRKQGVGPEVLVGICMDRSPETDRCDPRHLEGRRRLLPARSQLSPAAAVVHASRRPRAAWCSARAVGQQPAARPGAAREPGCRLVRAVQESDENPVPLSTAQNLAYVMYTSGSTGDPNGVAVCQQSVIRLVHAAQLRDADGERRRSAVRSPTRSTLPRSKSGPVCCTVDRLVLVPHDKPSLDQLSETLVRHRVSTLWLTSGLFHQMVDHEIEAFRSVRQLLAGGDVLSVSHVQRVLARAAVLPSDQRLRADREHNVHVLPSDASGLRPGPRSRCQSGGPSPEPKCSSWTGINAPSP